MSDLTQEAGIGAESPDGAATGIDPRCAAETAVVPNAFATELAELAWSHDDKWADVPTSREGAPPTRSTLRWIAAGVAVLTAGAAAVWLGTALYREEQPPKTVKAPVAAPVTTMPAPTPTAAPPPLALPPETAHPVPKYPWVSIAVSHRIRPNGARSISPGYGPTQYVAIQSALLGCRSAGNDDCSTEDSMMNVCIAIAVGAHGEYSTAAGPTRADAMSTARANLPRATAVQPFCPWDANDT